MEYLCIGAIREKKHGWQKLSGEIRKRGHIRQLMIVTGNSDPLYKGSYCRISILCGQSNNYPGIDICL